jgi:hypothetical protein
MMLDLRLALAGRTELDVNQLHVLGWADFLNLNRLGHVDSCQVWAGREAAKVAGC